MYQAVLISISLSFCMALVIFIYWVQRRRSLVSSGETRRVVRSASLKTTTDEVASGWWIGLLSTFLPIVGTGSLLAMRWQKIPGRFSIHWGLDGHVNGWAERSVGGVFGFLFAASILVIVVGLMGELVARSSPGHEGRSAMIRTTRSTLLACAWLITIVLCGTSVLPLIPDPSNLVPIVAMAVTVFSVGMAGYFILRWMRMSGVIAAAQDSTDRRFWKAGILYYNSEDSALWVPKRYGLGYTLNFGRPVSWLVLGLILLVPATILFFVHGSTGR
jgi:uncharacterized membrane protein